MDRTELYIQLTNTGRQTIQVLRFNTPFEETGGAALSVTRDGQLVPYIGALARRGEPSDADFLAIEPGATADAMYSISTNYHLDTAGIYSVSLREPSLRVRVGEGEATQTMRHGCGSVQIILARGEPAPHTSLPVIEDDGIGVVRVAVSTSGCSAAEEAQIARAVRTGEWAIRPGLTEGYVDSSMLYETWFGTYTPSRGDTVFANLTATWDPLKQDTYGYDCTPASCGPNWFAYVNGDCGSNTICLCASFWSGDWVDSQMGTVIHEASHLAAGTLDTVYGRNDCMDLAASDPSEAVKNADSYTFFGEDMYFGPVSALIMVSVM